VRKEIILWIGIAGLRYGTGLWERLQEFWAPGCAQRVKRGTVDQLGSQCGTVVITFRKVYGVSFGGRNQLLPVSQGSRRTGVRELHKAYRIGTVFLNNPLWRTVAVLPENHSAEPQNQSFGKKAGIWNKNKASETWNAQKSLKKTEKMKKPLRNGHRKINSQYKLII